MSTSIGFIGGGNMARSLIGGLIADGIQPGDIRVADPNQQQLDDIRLSFGTHATLSNREVAEKSDIVLLAVKPQNIHAVSTELAPTIEHDRPLVISIAAGIRLAHLGKWLGATTAIVRAMPNTPALVKSGATVLVANRHVSTGQRNQAESIMRAVGMTLWLEDESLMDAVTALSGSGPAYFFFVMEALEQAGEQLGLPRETARLLTLQTAFGAAKMALETTTDSHLLRERVTSPGGTTERAVNVLKDNRLEQIFSEALTAARDRSVELANILGNE
ncbi:MAG: pyrroline-5-carboxylate reductase [Gammaproteobacteria bacterium]|nr:MAG: pyrroline-5-carboxylate reductase [Gammaproteobacteria bacterium]TND03452.1 MAG: pyrroline-5-carboxylate reductase [Gammaproteobacteria bacterium]